MVEGKKDPAPDENEKAQFGANKEDLAIQGILKNIAGKWRQEMEQEAGGETETFILPPGGLKAHPQSDKERVPPEELPDTVILTPSDPDGQASTPSPKTDPTDLDEVARRVSPREELPDTVILTPPDFGAEVPSPTGETDVKDTTIGAREVSPEDALAETIIQTPSGLKEKTKGPVDEIQSEKRRSSDEKASSGRPERITEEKKPAEEPGGEDFSVETVIIKPGKLRKKREDGFED